ncbi:hypothetical protein [Microbacterium sp.]|uniref:hypothetical protein n=1 Tax=Microbacterium sp. TaxID=51671 RepID=UPI002606F99D|nr:hypothetical protein [Microbacterium sp.]
MAWFFLVWGSLIAGLVLSFVWWLIWGRRTRLSAGSVGVISLAAGLLLVGAQAVVRLMGTGATTLLPSAISREFWDWYGDHRFAVPLLLGILGMVVLAFPIRARSGRGAAEIKPRTPVSFSRRRWFITPALTLAFILVLTVIAGMASQPDSTTGEYTMYFVDLGGGRGMGTGIYGWFYSVPCLILTAVMIMVAMFDLFLIARPALNRNVARDESIRMIRTRNVLAVGTGALLMHLGVVFGSLAGTASVRSSFPTSEGSVAFWTTFAALEPALAGASSVTAAVGIAFWTSVALSAIPSRRLTSLAVES